MKARNLREVISNRLGRAKTVGMTIREAEGLADEIFPDLERFLLSRIEEIRKMKPSAKQSVAIDAVEGAIFCDLGGSR